MSMQSVFDETAVLPETMKNEAAKQGGTKLEWLQCGLSAPWELSVTFFFCKIHSAVVQ